MEIKTNNNKLLFCHRHETRQMTLNTQQHAW